MWRCEGLAYVVLMFPLKTLSPFFSAQWLARAPAYTMGMEPSKKTAFVQMVKGSTFPFAFVKWKNVTLAFVTCHETVDAG